jgi:branched-chain amino acid transport system ATP-binding protein
MPQTGGVGLEARDVAVHFGGVKAVDGVSLSLREGAIHGLMGPNGSGKSTLLAAITRLVDLTAGTLLFDGIEYHEVPPMVLSRRGVARTFQTVRLVPTLTVEENIMLAVDRTARGRRGRQRALSKVHEAIERTGLSGMDRMRPEELSYGTQRRAEIARAIACDPRLLLLDEPTAGMTPVEREDIAELLRELRSDGLTQLLVEHDVEMMMSTCDHLWAMNAGRVIAEGSPQEVVRNDQVRQAYLGPREHGRNASSR